MLVHVRFPTVDGHSDRHGREGEARSNHNTTGCSASLCLFPDAATYSGGKRRPLLLHPDPAASVVQITASRPSSVIPYPNMVKSNPSELGLEPSIPPMR